LPRFPRPFNIAARHDHLEETRMKKVALESTIPLQWLLIIKKK